MTHVDKFCLHVQGFFQLLTTPLFMRVCACACVCVCVCVWVCECVLCCSMTCVCMRCCIGLLRCICSTRVKVQQPLGQRKSVGTNPSGKGGRKCRQSFSFYAFCCSATHPSPASQKHSLSLLFVWRKFSFSQRHESAYALWNKCAQKKKNENRGV